MKSVICLLLIAVICSSFQPNWGFLAHRNINYHAVFTLPPDLLKFYKKHILYLKENAVTADKRKFSDPNEAPRHYIDLDLFDSLPPYHWNEAIKLYHEDSLNEIGILPWNLQLVKFRLTEAFKKKDLAKVLRFSADAGHYLGDAHVPLHTTSNYNGQKTNQHGIHGLWESRIPELMVENYELFTPQAYYLDDISLAIWETILHSNSLVNKVLQNEAVLDKNFPPDKKYSYENRGNSLIKTYSREYATRYSDSLDGMIENQLRKSINLTGCFWYTCWVDAGMPDLSELHFYENPQKVSQQNPHIKDDCHRHK